MRSTAAIIVAIIVAVPVWFLAALGLNLLDLARGETGWLQRLFAESFTPAVGAYVGMLAADKVVKGYSPDAVFFGFATAIITAATVLVAFMRGVAGQADWRVFDWVVMIFAPGGAVIGAWIAYRTVLRSTKVAKPLIAGGRDA